MARAREAHIGGIRSANVGKLRHMSIMVSSWLFAGRWDVPDNITQDWTGFLAKKRKELERLHGVYDSMLKKAGCDMFIGRATVVDPHTVEVDGKRYTVSAHAAPSCPA